MTSSVLEPNLNLSKLLDAESFREVCRSFSELYGIGVKIFDAEGHKLVDVRASTGDHCGYLFSVHPTRVMCTNLVNHIRNVELDATATEPKQIDCFSGLRYKIVPVVHEGKTLGRVIFGPYAPGGLEEPPDDLSQYEDDGLDLDKLNDFLSRIPRAGEQAVSKVLSNLGNVLDVIIHTSYKAVLVNQLHIASITGAFEDVQRSNKSLEEANSRLQELDRMKSNFIATVSHELRTPLTSVIGYSEMLLEGMAGELNAEQQDYVHTILDKGESLLTLIGQVLDLSRIESGNVLIEKRPTDPREILDESLSDVRPQAVKREISLESQIDDAVTPINVDGDKIHRVITNLLGNAVKFTPSGGTITVTIDVTEAPPVGSNAFDMFEPERNQYLRIAVADTGMGIPEDKLERVFDSFFQIDSSSTREFGGTGLGLSIVRNFVHAHGGHVQVESQVGEGSRFVVLLPYHPESPETAVGVDGVLG